MSRNSFIHRDRDHGSSSHRRAPKMEKSLARRLGGETVPGSGSGNQKGDIKRCHGVFRIECKTTKNKSFSVTRDMIRKIEEAALPNREVPAIVIEFIDDTGKPQMEVAVVPMWSLESIAEGNKHES